MRPTQNHRLVSPPIEPPRPQRRPPSASPSWTEFVAILAMMAISTVTIALVVSAAMAQPVPGVGAGPAVVLAQQNSAQPGRIRRRDIWKAVQAQLPDLPREDHYAGDQGSETGEPSTLTKRLIEYHNFRKGRSPISRFDWKLTLGDYLGINEPMMLASYPGGDRLTPNPLEGDRAAIRSLSPAQRNSLVNTLVRLHNPSIPDAFFDDSGAPLASPAPPASVAPPAAAPPAPRPGPYPLPQPGDADLLRPR